MICVDFKSRGFNWSALAHIAHHKSFQCDRSCASSSAREEKKFTTINKENTIRVREEISSRLLSNFNFAANSHMFYHRLILVPITNEEKKSFHFHNFDIYHCTKREMISRNICSIDRATKKRLAPLLSLAAHFSTLMVILVHLEIFFL